MSGGASSIVLRLFRQRLVDSTFLFLFLILLLLLPSPNLEAEALFFGSSDSTAAKEVDPEIKDLPHLSPHPDDNLVVGADGFDQKAFLGSENEVNSFTEMSQEDKVKGIKSLIKKIDTDKNGTISKEELNKWILHSVTTLKDEEAKRMFPNYDYDEDGKFSRNDHLYSVFGFEPTEEEIKQGVPGAEGSVEDHLYQMELFRLSDADDNGELSFPEFLAFFRPEDFERTRQLETRHLLKLHDADADGALDLKEFLKAELHEEDPKEWIDIETDRFHNVWDKDGDGFLRNDEVIGWAMPTNEEVASEETVHLFGVADGDNDGNLSVDEILQHLDTFAGSQATNYGKHLQDEL